MHLFLFSALIVGMNLAVLGQTSQKYSGEYADFYRAEELFGKEQYSAARKVFREFITANNNPEDPLYVKSLYYEGRAALELFNNDAVQLLSEFNNNYPENIYKNEIYFRIGQYFYQNNKYVDASQWLKKTDVRSLDTAFVAEYHFKLGYAHFQLGNFTEARNSFFEVKDTKSNYAAPATYYFSHIAYQNKSYQVALEGFLILLDNDAFKAEVPYYITHIYYLMGKYDEVIKFAPSSVDSIKTDSSGEMYRLIGDAYYRVGKYDEAVAYFEQYRLLGNGDIDFYNEFGSIYQRSSDFNKRIELHKEAIRKYPDTTRQRVMLINAYQRIGDEREALQTVDEAIAFFDSKKAFVFKGFKQSLLPILYDTEIEINQRRELFLRNSNILINTAKIETDDDKKYAYFLIRNINNYYLHFHAKNDLLIQIQHSTFVAKIMHILFPEFSISREIPKNISEKIRIGYVCHRSHSLGQLFLDWIKYANQEKFEIYFYDIGVAISPQTEAFRVYSHFYYHIPHNIEKVARQIHQDNLHILTFLDIAVEPEMCCLSTLKLATIQCNTWGHPITSGSVQIDYFLGSDAMEPLNAQDHYSEKLIRLPNLGICISQPDVPATKKNRSDFSLPEGKILYLSCQMTAKYLPQYDFIFPEIAKLVPNAYFIFFEAYESEKITGKLKQRLHNAFGKEDLVLDNFCQFIPRVSKDDYFNINFLSDVFLDTIGWSGGLTTIDAIACCLPIVTFPTEFMRGRQSGGMLKIINITETIANDLNEYITIAARLGIDPDWNAEIRSKMQSNKDRLFDDKSCIEALENFYEKIVKEQNIAIEY